MRSRVISDRARRRHDRGARLHESLRGYEASLILRAAWFERVKVLDGGTATWPFEIVTGRT